MNLSDHGAAFIARHEGLRLEPYNDPFNCTIGIGHLIHMGVCTPADHQKWGRLTEQQAYDLFRQDAAEFVAAVNAAVKVPLTQNQFDALVSFAYNVGAGALRSSTLLKKLNAGDYQGAAREFAKWNKAGGRVLKGLTRRRAEEAALFLRTDPGGAATIEVPRPEPAPKVKALVRGPSSKFARAEWLHPVFRIRLEALHDAVPFTVTSGGRSTKRQAELYRDFLAGRGNPANRPGTSWHEYDPDNPDPWTLAQAGDIEPARGYTDADLHREAKRFGLHFPIKGEPWHIQPLEAKSSKRTKGQGLGPVPSIEEPAEEEEEDMIKYGLITPKGGGPIFGVFVVPEEMELSDGTIVLPGMLAKVGFTNGNVLEAVIAGGYAKPNQPLIQLGPEEWDRIPHVGNV